MGEEYVGVVGLEGKIRSLTGNYQKMGIHREDFSMNPQTNFDKLQNLLRQIFQFDSADLDFGIYRILNQKRDRIEEFITKDLVKVVSAELDKGVLAEQSQAVRELKDVVKQIRETLGEEAIDADGSLDEKYNTVKIGKKYLELKEKTTGASSRSSLEAVIFNHLYTFFSRYYDSGDFMSKRRYSKREKYAIPYNGEEVFLYWANNDQYYVKTGEYFFNYFFNSKGIKVHFKLQNAQVEQDNIKGDKRFFIPLTTEASFNSKEKIVLIPFEYRLFNAQEEIKYGRKNQQESIIAEALEAISKHFKNEKEALAALMADRHKTSDGKLVCYLEYHLRRYTRRNTSDFFIHKDLKGFLERELDFYIKNEVLNVDEIESAGESRAEGWFQIMRVIKSIGRTIITFLAQIENFQKRLFEKKKFITETNYCITVQNIPEELYKEIAENEAQWKEWKELLHVDEEVKTLFTPKNKSKRRLEFLKSHTTLVVDTKHFDSEFRDLLLSHFENLDEQIDGLLVHGENFQTLNLLRDKYRQNVKCIHIDPPYNTQTSGFLYKNNYQHSSWLAMMKNRITAGIELMSADGSYLCHIDENEYERLQLMFEHLSIPDAGTIAWDKRNPMNAGRGVATQHEYVIWRSRQQTPIYLRNKNILSMLSAAAAIVEKYGRVTKGAQKEYADWINRNPELSAGEKAYRLLDEESRVYRNVSLRAPEPRTDPKFHIPLIHPMTGNPCAIPPNGFSRTPETLQAMMERGEIIFGPDETTQPQQKRYLTEESRRQISSVIQDGRKGKADVSPLGLDFPYCHPVSLYEELIGAAAQSPCDIILDYFAGSGTTAHAVINLNREDGVRRKFILVEIENYFDDVMLPRIKKLVFIAEWKDGKPKRMATEEEAKRSPRIIKYICLESYEDSLNNITFKLPKGQKTLKFDDYLINYMLDFETKESETFLNMEKLSNPFSYKLLLTEDQERKEKPVDLPETFNYLLGLHVKTRRVYHDGKRRYLVYRGTVDSREVVVIWRETKDWGKNDLERDKKFVKENEITEGANEIFVNGDSFIPGAKSIEPVFKHRMFGGI